MRILTICVVIALLSLSAVVQANILYVPGQFPTIQAAVNAAQSGDTIKVSPGVYNENVLISQSLYLSGADMFSTIIDAGGSNRCILVNANYTSGKISGFTLLNHCCPKVIFSQESKQL